MKRVILARLFLSIDSVVKLVTSVQQAVLCVWYKSVLLVSLQRQLLNQHGHLSGLVIEYLLRQAAQIKQHLHCLLALSLDCFTVFICKEATAIYLSSLHWPLS